MTPERREEIRKFARSYGSWQGSMFLELLDGIDEAEERCKSRKAEIASLREALANLQRWSSPPPITTEEYPKWLEAVATVNKVMP